MPSSWTLSDIEQSIPERFASIVARYPDQLALKTREREWTYREFNERSREIARSILQVRGEALDTVALYFEQGAWANIATLGTLMARKIYVPLDPAHPRPVLADILADAGARLVLTDTAHLAQASAFCAPTHVTVLNVQDTPATLVWPSAFCPPSSPDDPAHIYYTSGSTGKPKGVVNSHRNVLHTVLRYTNQLHIHAADRLTLLQSPAFSAVVSSVFSALMNGASLFPVLLHAENPDALADWLIQERVSIYHSVPALFRSLMREGRTFPDIRVVRLEGDQASRRDVELFRAHFPNGAVLANGLGTTETNLVSQYFLTHATPLDTGVVPVGHAVSDMRILILNDAGDVLAPGQVGEIAVASRYLATGYWRNPQATAARFVSDPHDREGRIYRTGDVGRLCDDGCLEFLGRGDSRVKVRGQFVEPTAVEESLLGLTGVQAAAVVAVKNPLGEHELVAFLVGPGQDPVRIRADLAARLPPHQIPTRFVFMASLPLSGFGKVDRRALSALAAKTPTVEEPFDAPQDEMQANLAIIWASVLRQERVGIHTSFLDLGGDSLHAIQVLSRINTLLPVSLTIGDLFDAPTIAEQARLLQQQCPAPINQGE